MFRNALEKDLEFPADLISKDLANLLSLMLHKNHEKRINKGQINLIKNHPWCKDINWT